MRSKANDGGRIRRRFDLSKYMVYIIMIFVLILFAVWLGSKFFSMSNMLNITKQTAMISVMAVTMTFVLATGNIDLSIGSVVAVCSLICGLVLQSTNNIVLAVAATLAAGTAFGLINGLLVVSLKIPSFLVTLGMMIMLKGFAMVLTNTKAVPILNDTFNNLFGFTYVLGVPVLLLWTVAFVVIGIIILNYLPFGRKTLATGGNRVSAIYSGIKVDRVVVKVMAMSGFAAAFAALMYSARMQTARYTFGEGVEMDVIAAVVLGGTSMSGGTGTVFGALVGSILLGIINNGLILGGLTVAEQEMVSGFLIIFAVALNSLGSRKKTA